jgi:hypothetical protein
MRGRGRVAQAQWEVYEAQQRRAEQEHIDATPPSLAGSQAAGALPLVLCQVRSYSSKLCLPVLVFARLRFWRIELHALVAAAHLNIARRFGRRLKFHKLFLVPIVTATCSVAS